MNKQLKVVDQSEIRDWVLLSVFLGLGLGIGLASFPLASANLAGNPWLWFFWVPGLICAICLAFLGLFADTNKRWHWLTNAASVLLLATLWLHYLLGFNLPPGLFGPLVMVGWGTANAIHKTKLARCPYESQRRLSSVGLLSMVLPAMLVYFGWPWLSARPGLILSLFLAMTLLGSFTYCTAYLRGRSTDNPTLRPEPGALSQTFGNFISPRSSFVLKAMVIWTLLTVALTKIVQALILESGSFVNHSQSATVALFLACALGGAGLAGQGRDAWGPRRRITLGIILCIGLIGLTSLASTPAEWLMIAIPSWIVCGSLFVHVQSFWSWMVRREWAGQGFAFFYLLLFCGVGLGLLLPGLATESAGFWQVVIALFAVLIGIHMLAQKWRKDQDAETPIDNGDPGFDWELGQLHNAEAKPLGLTARLMKALSRTLAEIFFGRIRIRGLHHLQGLQGAVLVANHPNTFLDPLLITALMPTRLNYLAKSTLWKVPMLGSLLDRLGAIPVYRRKDFPTGQSNDNQSSLSAAAQQVAQGGWVLIFPEGISEIGLSLKPLRTGAARLGFQALTNHELEDVPILPIGIDYLEPTLFRTEVTIRVGEPIWLDSYIVDYQHDSRATVVEVTQQISESMKGLLPHLDDPELETLVHQIRDLYGDRLLKIMNEEDETAARQAISQAVNHYQEMDPDTLLLFSQRMNAYHAERQRLSTPENHPPIPVGHLLRILAGFCTFVSYGMVVNYVPYKLTDRMIQWLSPGTPWLATAKLGFGSLVFGAYYGLTAALVTFFFSPVVAAILVMTFAVSALLAMGSIDRFAFRFQQLKTL